MKLTKLKVFVMALLCAMSLNAQEAVENVQDVEKKVKRSHELGLNMTALAEFVFDRTANQELASPYLFTYKLLNRAETGALRFGLGGDVRTSSDPDDERKAYNNEYDFRVGIEKRNMLTKRWMIFYGADLTMGYSTLGSKTEDIETQSNVYSIGGGPILGIQVMFNERIGLNTEMKLYYEHREFVDRFLSNGNSNNDVMDKFKLNEVKVYMPFSLYLTVKL